jgi:hypothetical protein
MRSNSQHQPGRAAKRCAICDGNLASFGTIPGESPSPEEVLTAWQAGR